jgi:hypothetical protein
VSFKACSPDRDGGSVIVARDVVHRCPARGYFMQRTNPDWRTRVSALRGDDPMITLDERHPIGRFINCPANHEDSARELCID